MKVMLVFPPQWTPAMPHLALPALTAFLRSHGVDVVQRDLNVESYDALLTRAALDAALARLRADYPRGRPAPEPIQAAWAGGRELAAQVDNAKTAFRSPAFYDGTKSLAAFEILARSLELASLPFHPAQLDLLNFTPAAPADNSRRLLQAVRDERHNLFLDLFRRLILPDIQREQPDVVGISIPTLGQMLPAMTLAHLLKQARLTNQAGLPCHVTAGGPHITMLREQLPRVPQLFSLIDSAVIFDGETPLLRLAEAVCGNGKWEDVPNLIYKMGDQIRVNPALPVARREWLTPDFHGLPLDRYLAPERVLPLMTAHGCYHGRCGFCNVGYGAPQSGGGKDFYPLPVERVIEQVETLHKEYGARHIFFADEAIPPRTLRLLSAALAEHEPPMHWCGCARLERTLSAELLQGMSRGGCRMLLFGLETAAERMIAHMVKGTERQTMSRVLRDSAQAGIWNHTFFFFGFPTETMGDAQDTVNFVYEHQDAIHSASPGEFVLERYSPVHQRPKQFGVRRILERPEQDLAIYYGYELESGLDESMAHTLVERLLDVLPTKQFGQYYLHDVYRFLYASHLHATGQPPPPWLIDES